MACVNKLLVGCNDITRMPFDMQNSVLKAVCSDRRQEYLDSSRCFSTTSLRERIELRCLSKAANQRRLRTEPCRLTEEIISCADGAVRMTNGCAVRDAQLMASLLFDFLSILCETWKEGLTTTDSMRTVTTSTTLVSLPKVERPSKRIETDKPLRGNGSPRSDKPLLDRDSSKSKPIQKDQNNSSNNHVLSSNFCALSCLPILLVLSHIVNVCRFS